MPSLVPNISFACSAARDSEIQRVKDSYRLVVMGTAKVGKTAIIQQFLYDRFPSEHKPTVEELHRGEYEIRGNTLTLDILDTSGSYEFPAMRRLAITTSDAFVVVFALDDEESFKEARHLRDLILELRPGGAPIAVVGNKCDLQAQRTIRREIVETIVTIDWENGYVEASAKTGENIVGIFKEVLAQAHIHYALSPAVKRRRKSLPSFPTQPRIKTAVNLKRNSCSLS